jgi:hypothetical protein
VSYLQRDIVVQVMGIFIAPTVVSPVYNGLFYFGVRIDDKGRPMIPAPGIIGRMNMKINVRIAARPASSSPPIFSFPHHYINVHFFP